MRAVSTDLFHLFLTLPFYFLLAGAWLTFAAFRGRAPAWHRYRFAFLAFTLLTYGASIPAATNAVRRQIESWYPIAPPIETARAQRPVIITLTAGWMRITPNGYEAHLGEPGWERTWAAVALWERIGGTIMFVGAPNRDHKDSAAAAMARVAMKLGVPKDKIIIETESLNTHENILFAKPLLPSGAKPIYLITSALQMPRAYDVARHEGLAVIPYAVDPIAQAHTEWQDWVPNNNAPQEWESMLHEMLGILAYRLRGWA